MRTFAIVAVIVTLLGGGSVWYTHYISSSTGILVEQIDQVDERIQNQDWDKANSSLKKMENDWEKTKNLWSVLITHQEIDSIDITLKRLEEFVRLKSPVLAAGELSSLRLLVDHIADTEAFNLRNIF